MNNELFSTGGYRLASFQLYNWGVFDKSIYTLNCGGESSLLTGANGSGKTTIVDAILTLLVPSQQRFYNQSSGADKKRDRNEEDYVLGCYGSVSENGTTSAKRVALRKQDTFSVLNGIFILQGGQSAVSLLQVRYFTDNTLQRVFAVIKQQLTLEEINATLAESGSLFDKTGRWKKILSAKYNTMFFGDSFKKYSDTFTAIFGLRSDKALRLFSQIVGLKVLGNFTEFIRENMIESIDSQNQFDKLLTNYKKLMVCNNEIQKTKKILALLEPVLENGNNLRDEECKKTQLEKMRDTLPAWYAQKSTLLLTKEKEKLSAKKHTLEQNKCEVDVLIKSTTKLIEDIQNELATNDTAQRIKSIDRDIEELKSEKERRHLSRNAYETLLQEVGFSLPAHETAFTGNLEKLHDAEQKNNENAVAYEDKLFDQRKKSEEINSDIVSIKKELESLSNRSSNIPDANIQIRDAICLNTGCDASVIPFAGELIQVLPSESKWRFAIEKLLHNFALTLLVPENKYKAVTKYVKENDMKGRVVYFKVSNNSMDADFFSLQNKQNKMPDADTVPGKIQIKENTQVASWLSRYIADQFDYRCTDDVEQFAKAEKAVSSTGLIKNRLKHEKDDRRNKAGAFMHVLGWDNREKRNQLSGQLDDLHHELQRTESDLKKLINMIEESKKRTVAFSKIFDYTTWSTIDVQSVILQIDTKNEERKKLLKNDRKLEELQRDLDAGKKRLEQANETRDEINREIGAVNNSITDNNRKLEECNGVLSNYQDVSGIDEIHSQYPRLSEPQTLDELKNSHGKISGKLSEAFNGCTKRIQGFTLNLINSMSAILSPSPEMRNKYGDWTSEFSQLNSGPKFFPEFVSLHERLTRDDLPKYQEEFREYLHDTMNNDIVDFNQFLQNGEQEIKTAVSDLNTSLAKITYESTPETYLQLIMTKSADSRISEFKNLLKNAIPDAFALSSSDSQKEEALFENIKLFLDTYSHDDAARKYVLDVRNWYTFAATENERNNNNQKKYYQDSGSLSGGEKAKLTYTILASAIAYQFGLTQNESDRSFRFAIIDEAFSKSDAANSDYAMRLFKQLDLQLMVITPLDKINVVEDYISTVHITENKGTSDSRLLCMTIEKYHEGQEKVKQ